MDASRSPARYERSVMPPELPSAVAPPAASLAVTYVILAPMIVFAVHGGFSFEPGAWSSGIGAVGGKIAAPSGAADTLRESVQSWTTTALCLLPMAAYWRQIAALCRRMPLMTILPAYAMASSVWSQDPSRSLRSGLLLLVMSLFAFYLAVQFSEGQQMEIVIMAGGCVGVLSLATVFLWPQFGVDHQLHEGAWQGIFTQKNVCAEATLFMLTPAFAFRSGGRYGQMLRAIYASLCLLIIAMTQSRTGWAMTLLYLGFIYSLGQLGRFHRKDLLPVAALGFAAAGSAVLALIQYPAAMLSLLSRSDSLSGRAQIWSAIMASILRRPIGGYGFDAFWSLLQGEATRVFASAGWIVTSAHNGFLNVGLELGLMGVALVAATFVQAIRNANAVFHPGRSGYVDWCIGIVFLTFVYNLDERTLLATQYLPWILYILACTGLSEAVRKSERHANECPVERNLA